ncbi:MAG: hypothetical protein P4K83_06845 [Terracidiphilus sp.]|nr:hypothetical protein [Terracidiphilus sp.]
MLYLKTMKELWTAQVHILTPPSARGNTRCCTNIVAWAESPAGYEAGLRNLFERQHWSILSIRQCMRIANCIPTTDELLQQIELAREQGDGCIFGTLCYYPSKPC